MSIPPRSPLVIAVVTLAILAALAAPAAADSAQLRIGAFFPAAGGPVWDAATRQFTLEESDLHDAIGGATFLHALGDQVELGLDLSFYEARASSAERGVSDDLGLPIFHDTELTLVPAMIDLRLVPGGREESRGRHGEYARRRTAFYLGGGIGAAFWRYEEIGDFADLDSGLIFFDRFHDTGATLAAHALAGVDVALGDQWGLVAEGRYLWAEDDLDLAARRPGRLDLSGPSLMAGVSFHF